jgi:hypothetical protein
MFSFAVCRLQIASFPPGDYRYSVFGNVRMYFTRPQMLSAVSTLPNAGIPVNLMPLLMIQNSSRSEQLCTRLLVRSGARGYIHCPDGVLARPSTPWHMLQSRPKCVPPASTMALVSTGGGGIPWRLVKRKTECLARFAIRVSKEPGSCSAVKLKCVGPIPISTTPDATIVQMIRDRIRFSSAAVLQAAVCRALFCN